MDIYELRIRYGNSLFPRIREELINIAHEQPDFVYNPDPDNYGCNYNGPARNHLNLNGPECSGCIVGQALQRIGWDDPSELEYDGYVEALIPGCPNDITEVQTKQDSGLSWGDAVAGVTLV